MPVLNLLRATRALASAVALACTPLATAASLTWTTAVDHAVPSNTNQLRSLALSNDQASIYVGYIQSSGNRRVDQHSTASPYAVLDSHASGGDQPKAIDTDDRGNVFIANRNSGNTNSFLQSFDSALSPISSTSNTSPVVNGLAIHKIGNDYFAYAAFETGGLIQRYNVTNTGAMVLDATFNGSGSFNIPGASDLRGIEVGSDGTIYVASRGGNAVFKVSSDLSTVTSAALTRAMDVAIYGSNLYATSYNGTSSLIRSLSLASLSFVEDITISTLDGNPYSRGSSEGWSGIEIDSAGNIWLADQQYSGSGTGTRDRLIVGKSLAIPEPATLVMLGLASVIAIGGTRRRQK